MFNAIDYAAFIQAIAQAKQAVDTAAAEEVEEDEFELVGHEVR